MKRRSRPEDEIWHWVTLGIAILAAWWVVWLTDPQGQLWLKKYQEDIRSHVNRPEHDTTVTTTLAPTPSY